MPSTPTPIDAPREQDWPALLDDPSAAGEAARRALREHLVRGLRRALATRGVGPDLCEDFAQEALLRIRERRASFRGDARFTTWAMTIATRLAFDELRRRRWGDVSLASLRPADDGIEFEIGVDPSQERDLLRQQVVGLLREVLDRELTAKQRAVLVAELAGMPHAEIAQELAMNRNALYKLSHDARRKVKARLEAAGLLGPDALAAFEQGRE